MAIRISKIEYYEKGYYTKWYVFPLQSYNKMKEIYNIDFSKYYESFRLTGEFNHPYGDWCNTNIEGKYVLTSGHICFENKVDAMLFKLSWE
jgi:hypothetical protein